MTRPILAIAITCPHCDETVELSGDVQDELQEEFIEQVEDLLEEQELQAPDWSAFSYTRAPKTTYKSGGGTDELELMVAFRMTDPDATVDLPFCMPVILNSLGGRPTPAQRDAMEQFYHLRLPELTSDMAHVLLSVRQYAKALSERIAGPMIDKRDIIARVFAQFLLAETKWIEEAVWASEAKFDRLLDAPPLTTDVIEECEAHLRGLIGGVDEDRIKVLRGLIEPSIQAEGQQ